MSELTWEEVAAQAATSPLLELVPDPDEGCCPTCGRAMSDPTEDGEGKAHADANQAERRAAWAQKPRTGTARYRVLQYLLGAGGRGATDEEIAETLRMRHYTAAPRRTELVAGGWATDSGRTRRTSTGSEATVWVITPIGEQRMRAA